MLPVLPNGLSLLKSLTLMSLASCGLPYLITLLHIEVSEMRAEKCMYLGIYGYNNNSLRFCLILCPFSRKISVSSPLKFVTSLARGS